MDFVLTALCGLLLATAGGGASIVFPQRRPPPPSAETRLRTASSDIELAARLNRLEETVVLHHTATARRLEAIVAHLAALTAADRQATQLAEEARQERRQMTQLAEEVRQERRDAAQLAEQARAERQRTAAALGRLAAAVRGQTRALRTVGAALPGRRLTAALTNHTAELRRARHEDGERHRQLSREVADVSRIVTRTDAAVTEQAAVLTGGLGMLTDGLSQLAGDLSQLQARLNRTESPAPTPAASPDQLTMQLVASVRALQESLSSVQNTTDHFLPALDERVASVTEQSERRSEGLREGLAAAEGRLRAAAEGVGRLRDQQTLQADRLDAAMMVLGGLTDGQRSLNRTLMEGQQSLNSALAGLTESHASLDSSLVSIRAELAGLEPCQTPLRPAPGVAEDPASSGGEGSPSDSEENVTEPPPATAATSGVDPPIDTATEGPLSTVVVTLTTEETATTAPTTATEPTAVTEGSAVKTTAKPFSLLQAFLETVREREEQGNKT